MKTNMIIKEINSNELIVLKKDFSLILNLKHIDEIEITGNNYIFFSTFKIIIYYKQDAPYKYMSWKCIDKEEAIKELSDLTISWSKYLCNKKNKKK